MAIAATQSPELAEEVARASGEELRMVGVNWTYAPVGDVNTDSRNPVIGMSAMEWSYSHRGLGSDFLSFALAC